MKYKLFARWAAKYLGCRDTFLVALFAAIPPLAGQSLPSFNWMRPADSSGQAYTLYAGGATDAQGNVYVVGSTRSMTLPVVNAVQSHLATAGSYDVFVTKYDPFGKTVYSTYFGGSADDIARAMTVDPSGNVYIAGTTVSQDLPTTPGSYSPAMPTTPPMPASAAGNYYEGAIFLFKLKPDGSLAWSTYFTSQSFPTDPSAIAVDAAGAVYLTGITFGGLPTTPGAYRTSCTCGPPSQFFFGPPIFISDAYVTKFDPTGSSLVYSSYLGIQDESATSIAVGPDGTAYLGGAKAVYRIDAAGASLLNSAPMLASALTAAPDGRVYIAASPLSDLPLPSPGAAAFYPVATMGANLIIMDAPLQNTLAAAYFGGGTRSMVLDAFGNLYLGGGVNVGGLSTRTPLQIGFGGSLVTGFAAELSGDLATVLFSSYFGDGEFFFVNGVGPGANGAIALAGVTDHGNVWANSVQPASPLPALRIDSIQNAASHLAVPIAPGETIALEGAGFGGDAVLLLGATSVPTLSIAPNEITAVVPPDISTGPVTVQVQSAGSTSNQVLLNVTPTSPGLFSADESGAGQAYIVNEDGSLNSPANPAAPGRKITIFATGVGPLSLTDGYAVTQFPADAYIDGFHCDGLAAVLGPVAGFPGSVYQLTVVVPNPASMAASNPNLQGFKFPSTVPVVLQSNGRTSQPLAISIANQ